MPYRHRRAEHLPAGDPAGAARGNSRFRTQGETGRGKLRTSVARPFPGTHPFGAVLRTSKFAPGEFVGSAHKTPHIDEICPVFHLSGALRTTKFAPNEFVIQANLSLQCDRPLYMQQIFVGT